MSRIQFPIAANSVIVLRMRFGLGDFAVTISTTLDDESLLRRDVTAVGEDQKMQGQKQQQEDINNANQAKPNL